MAVELLAVGILEDELLSTARPDAEDEVTFGSVYAIGISVDAAVKLCDGAKDVVFTIFELIMTVGISDDLVLAISRDGATDWLGLDSKSVGLGLGVGILED